MDTILALDSSILLFIQDNLRCSILNFIMKIFSAMGDGVVILAIMAVIFLLFPKCRRASFYAVCAIAFCFVINNLILKNWVARIRPYEVVDGLELIIAIADDWSFPSGHACAAFAAAFMFTKCKGGWWGLTYIPAALIALSRIYVGIHYPTDIIAGAAIGTLGALLVYIVFNHFRLFMFDKSRQKL